MVHTKNIRYITNYTVHIVSVTLYLVWHSCAALRLSITLSTTTILRNRDKASYMHYLRELEVAR